MKISNIAATAVLAVLLALPVVSGAELSWEKAQKTGEENLQKLTEQSYHYRVEYDTVIVVPVHSKTVWKNDFYLLYFLNDGYFQVEMEVDKVTGDPTILSMGKMSQPYHAQHTGAFNYRYFDADSILHFASARRRLKQDSVRMVYFGVIPRLGKRGVIWEAFSNEGQTYISLGGPNLTLEQLVRDLNTAQHKGGNYVVDSIRMSEIVIEFDRLKSLTEDEKRELRLYEQAFDAKIQALKDERQEILKKFPNLGRFFPLEE
jgi:hypothetical protein